MKVFESKHLCCGYWVWVFVSAVFLRICYKSNKRSCGDAFTEDGNDIVEQKSNVSPQKKKKFYIWIQNETHFKIVNIFGNTLF